MITDNSDHQHPNNQNGSIAVGVSQNEKMMDGFFSLVGTGTGMTVDVHKVVGRATAPDPFDCDNIDATIRALPVNAGDAVMIYYAGHGLNIGTEDPVTTAAQIRYIAPAEFRSRPLTEFPFLACGTDLGDSPNLDMIATWLAPKQPRLTIVMADACNSFLPGTGPAAETFFVTAAPVAAPEARLRSLFREASGTVLIAGSERGHYSYYNVAPGSRTGGIFTLKFLDVIGNLPREKPTTWQEVRQNLGSVSVRVKDRTTDTQVPLLSTDAPFSTAIPTPVVSGDKVPASALMKMAQAMQFAPSNARTQQIAPGTPEGPPLGPRPQPNPPIFQLPQRQGDFRFQEHTRSVDRQQ